MMMKCIDFFAGIGAWELAINLVSPISEIKFETIKFIEINRQAQRVLRSHFPKIPIHSDVRSYLPRKNEADVFLISFPCTGTSIAGKKNGLRHEDSELWFEALRCIIIGRPSFVVIEQPKGVIYRGLRTIIAGLKLAGYQTEIEIFSASEFGAPHERQRVFIIAYADDLCVRESKYYCCWSEQIGEHIAIAKSFVSHPETQSRSMRLDDGIPIWLGGINFDGWWKFNKSPLNSGIGLRTYGRRESVSLYGKSIVPQCATLPLMRIQFLASLLLDYVTKI